MIVVTGGAGFIGSAIVWKLNELGEQEIVIVDELGSDEKWKNLTGLKYIDYYNKNEFIELIIEDAVPFEVDAIIHMGACSSTTEKDADYLMQNNYHYSQDLAKFCLTHKSRFIYASSAATYGDGKQGYEDDQTRLNELRPMNMYGYSKHLFDLWLHKMGMIEEVVGLKFFNVYGPNEYHKQDMRSVVHKAYEQICDTGKVKLFKSYKPDYKDGEQVRDFIYVKDAVDMVLFFLQNKNKNGLYNVGTGKARSWKDLVTAVFNSLNKEVNIEFIDMPLDIRDKYQYHTEANCKKIINAGYTKETYSLDAGIEDYVKKYLVAEPFLGY
ncbi:MAG: ADP-glyceromanno-heptose 6-epimerase [Ignavibacteriae bacterium HGW-Ignavibacteriae-2]|jgi:ADP-L-glycero-D-manno-heptose 6-epimerase|nr:ADP-glyceromanno-heptose 6-epimerase [Bacteroidota bacterium]PKL87757.1 MAG: ADP-glyceromanno-heptose 6-epimerase [Ignavibacteriae bacterium HGW-Ignavibacteriae-2]